MPDESMDIRRVHRKIDRTPEQLAELRAARDEFQREKPSLADLTVSGDYEEPPMPSDPARSHEFTVILAGVDRLTVALTGALYAAGCHDCTPSSVGPIVTLRFLREAVSLAHAVGSAIANVEDAGFAVARIEVARAGR